jgi:hypothetical protein
MSDVTIQSLKALAKSLRSDTVSHSKALELAARQHGFKDWNTAAALAPKDTPVNPWAFDSIRRKLEHFQGEYLAIKKQVQSVVHQRRDPRFADFLTTFSNYVGEIADNAAYGDALASMRYALYDLRLPTDPKSPGCLKFSEKYRDIIERDESFEMVESLLNERIPGLCRPKKTMIPYGKLVEVTQRIVSKNTSLNYREVGKLIAEEYPNGDFTPHSIKHIMQRGAGWKPKASRKRP